MEGVAEVEDSRMSTDSMVLGLRDAGRLKADRQTGRVWYRLPAWIPGSYLIREFALSIFNQPTSALSLTRA